MPRVSFPQEPSQLAAMERNLQNADSLMQVHRTVEQLTDLSRKTGEIARNLFEAAFKRSEELEKQETYLNHYICHLRQEINDLMIGNDRMAPDQIAQTLDELREKIFSCTRPCTRALQQELRSLKNQWNHLDFLNTFPTARELIRDSFISNFFYQRSLQIEEVEKRDPNQAAELKKQLRTLEQECSAAEELYCGKGEKKYQELPKNIKLSIRQLMFAHDPARSMEDPDPEQREVLAGAIMADVANRMVEMQDLRDCTQRT